MRFLRQNTAVLVTVGPFYDKTDGVTIETALTITNERITLTADTDDNSAPTNVLDNVTGATSGTSNDLNYITGNDAGMMQLELSASNTNRVGRMLLSITDAANHVPVFHEFFVLPQAIYDWLTGVVTPLPANVTQFAGSNITSSGGRPEVNVSHLGGSAIDQSAGLINANVKQISADATAADNAESFFDGTGYAGTGNTIPTVTTLTNAPSDSAGVTTLLSRIPNGLFTGITSLAQWLGMLAGKQTGNSTARTEIRATGAGSGTFDETTDSLEAVRDKETDIETDTQDIQSRLPAALVSGRMDSSVGAYQSGLTPLQPTVAGRTLDVTATGEAGIDWANIGGPTTVVNLSGTTVKTATDIETDTQDIQNRLPAALVSGRMNSSVSEVTSDGLKNFFNSDSGETYGSSVPGSVVQEIADNAGGGTPPTAAAIADAVWEEAIADHSGTAGSTAEALSDAGSAGDPWNTTIPGSYGAGTAGKIVGDNLNTTVSSRLASSAISLSSGKVTVGANDDKTGYSLSGAAIQAIWDALTSALTTAGSIGKWIVDKLDVVVSTRLATSSYAAPLDAAGTRSAVGLASANLDTQLDALPTNAELATALAAADDPVLAAIAALNNLSSAGAQAAAAAALAAYDPPTRTEATSDKDEVLAQVNANETKIDLIKAKTDSLTFTQAGEVDANTHSVNDVAVTGTGVEGDEWRPA